MFLVIAFEWKFEWTDPFEDKILIYMDDYLTPVETQEGLTANFAAP